MAALVVGELEDAAAVGQRGLHLPGELLGRLRGLEAELAGGVDDSDADLHDSTFRVFWVISSLTGGCEFRLRHTARGPRSRSLSADADTVKGMTTRGFRMRAERARRSRAGRGARRRPGGGARPAGRRGRGGLRRTRARARRRRSCEAVAERVLGRGYATHEVLALSAVPHRRDGPARPHRAPARRADPRPARADRDLARVPAGGGARPPHGRRAAAPADRWRAGPDHRRAAQRPHGGRHRARRGPSRSSTRCARCAGSARSCAS